MQTLLYLSLILLFYFVEDFSGFVDALFEGFLLSDLRVFEFFGEADDLVDWADFLFEELEVFDFGAEIRDNKLLVIRVIVHDPLQKLDYLLLHAIRLHLLEILDKAPPLYALLCQIRNVKMDVASFFL